MNEGDNGFLVEFGEMTLVTQELQPIAKEIWGLLEEFKDICETKGDSPPTRFSDHLYKLKQGSNHQM